MEDVGATTKAVPDVVLSSGHKMPLIGFGTATVPPLPTEALIAVLVDAIEAGYRHIDTAEVYGSEEALRKAMAQALERGVIKSRDEVFITSKVWPTHANRDLILPALKESLRRLGLDYVDLYLIHLPVRLTEETIDYNITKECVLEFDIRGTWEAMEECCNLGFSKSIGVSNFGPKKLSRILEFCTIPPAVNQVEMNVGWQQEKLRDCCRENRIHVSAWSPLAANGAIWGSMAVMESPILKSIAEARGTTLAQVALRWVYEQEASVIVKSYNRERMRDNLKIFDSKGELTGEELEKIKQIPQNRGFTGKLFVVEGSLGYKSLDEQWE